MLKRGYTIYAIMIIIAMSLNVPAQDSETPEVSLNNGCSEEPTDLIRVTAQQISKIEPAYVFTVTNLSKFPVSGLIIGEGNAWDFKFLPSEWNTPTKMEAPDRWEAHLVHSERSYYLWLNRDREKMIQPGKTVSDFRVYLPEDTRKVINANNTQENFKDLPFNVTLSNVSCLWGVIKTVDYMD